MGKLTQLTKILHDRRSRRLRHIPSLLNPRVRCAFGNVLTIPPDFQYQNEEVVSGNHSYVSQQCSR